MSEGRRLFMLGASLAATAVIISIGILGVGPTAETRGVAFELRGCRLLAVAYLPGFDLTAEQRTGFQRDALARFRHSDIPEISKILQMPGAARWVRFGAWCNANYGHDAGVRKTHYPTD
jgi:hypothetical protein